MAAWSSPSSWTPDSVLSDVKEGGSVMVNGRRGKVVTICSDPQYPMEIQLEGDTSGRTIRPIFYSIERA